jgi:hypothetical protein
MEIVTGQWKHVAEKALAGRDLSNDGK